VKAKTQKVKDLCKAAKDAPACNHLVKCNPAKPGCPSLAKMITTCTNKKKALKACMASNLKLKTALKAKIAKKSTKKLTKKLKTYKNKFAVNTKKLNILKLKLE